MILTSHSLEETRKIAQGWLADISKKYAGLDRAALFGLSGHLGAGKTAFVKMIAEEMGVKEDVTSPTFVLMKTYEVLPRSHLRTEVPPLYWSRLVHIDAYRLERPGELDALRFEDVIADKNNLVLVEWPEQVALENFGELGRIKFVMKEGVCSIAFPSE